MRILIVNYEFPPIGGGASYASANLAQRLVARGHEVDVLTSRLDGQPEQEVVNGYRVHRVTSWRKGVQNCGLGGAASFVWFAWRRMRQLVPQRRYHVVHYFFGLPTGILALYTRQRWGLPYVLSLRGSDVPGFDPTDRVLVLLHQMLARVNRRIWRRASAVVPNSDGLAELARKFEPGLGYRVIPNAMLSISELLDAPEEEGRSVRLVCVSRLIERKGIDILLEAVAGLGDLHFDLDIVGGGREQAALTALAASLGIGDRVHFHGSVPHELVYGFLQRADVFVLPTLSESSSMALLEALGMGLPVITTAVGGNVNTIKDGVTGLLVRPGDAADLAAGLRRLLTDHELRLRLVDAALGRTIALFTWEANAARYEALYVASQASAGQPALST